MHLRFARVAFIAVIASCGLAAPVAARAVPSAPEPTSPPPTTQAPAPTIPTESGSLIPIPVGCPVPDPAALAFVGTMVGKDDITQTVRFRIDQLRAGSGRPWAIDGLIDVRFGPDYRFLDEGEQYLVGAGYDPTYGVLSSKVRPAEPTFGGNDVVGVDDVSIDCPVVDDPVRTLSVDGSSVDSGVLSLLVDDKRLLLATLAVPTAIAFAALLALVVLKTFGVLAAKGMLRLGRAAVTPVPDHRVTRVRRHHDVPSPTHNVSTAADPASRSGGDRGSHLVERP